MQIISIVDKLKDFNEVINSYVDKFTSNPFFAFIVAGVMVIFIFVGVSSFTRK